MMLVRALLLLVSMNNVLSEEPHCSKYDFEEKVLQKIVRMEFNENQKQVEFERLKSDVAEQVEKLESLSTNAKNKIDLKVAEIYLKVAETVDKVDKTVAKVDANTKLLSDFGEKFARLEKQIMDQLQTIQEMTQTVAFKARLNSDIGVTAGQTIVYPTVMFNFGNGYDSYTGVFTSPVNGTYMFDIVVCPFNDKKVTFTIVVDDEQNTGTTFYGNEGHTCYSSNAVAVLKSEQRVKIKVTYASSAAQIDHSDIGRWNTFSGVLVHV